MYYRNGRKIYTSENGRKSLRLKGYDYSSEGLYFITICCQDMASLFGEVVEGEMVLNDAGKMVEKWYYEIVNKYPDTCCHEMVVMPNHIHFIIENVASRNGHVVAPTQGCPYVGVPTRGEYGMHNQKYGASIPEKMDWFKTMTTNEYIRGVKQLNWKRYNKRLWQRSYHDHIIRNKISYQNITAYIINNPKKWGLL